VEWYAEKRQELFSEKGPPASESKRIAKRKNISAETGELQPQIDVQYQKIETLVRFWSALTKHEPLTMREFVKLANDAFKMLGIESDLSDYPEWRVHNPVLEDYLPGNSVSLEEMLEGDARLLERQMLGHARVAPNDLAAWRNISIAGRYAAAYDWLISELGSVEVARVAIEIALTTPIDLVCKAALDDGVIYVEDCLPSWRLKRVCETLKRSAWPLEREEAEIEARYRIAHRAGIPTPSRTLTAIGGDKLAGDHGWSALAKITGIHSDPTSINYFEYCMEEMKRGLSMRSKDFLAFSHRRATNIFRPALEFYTDTIDGTTGFSLPFHLQILQTLMGNIAILEILFGEGDLKIARQLESSFLRRLAENGITVESINWLGLRRLMKPALGRQISKLVRW
jgi:hypothetical protein